MPGDVSLFRINEGEQNIFFALEKSFRKRGRSLGHESMPPPLRHPPIAIVMYYLLKNYLKCAPSPNGGLVAQEGGSCHKEKVFSRAFFFKDTPFGVYFYGRIFGQH